MAPMPQPPTTRDGRADFATDLARRMGFALVGIAPALPAARGEFLKHWLEEGRHGEMDYLRHHLEQRLDPRTLLPGARSVICVADWYGPTSASKDERPAAEPAGRIARYAWGNDYHQLIKKRLHQMADALRTAWPEHVYRSSVDTAPVLEREHAGRAGLGWAGKHTLLIHPEHGSYLLLGEIVTTLELTPTYERLGMESPEPLKFFGNSFNGCGSCTRCLDVCPTDCLEPHKIDASRCISYLTLEHRSPIDPSLHEAMGDWIAGCDACQSACPFNQQPAEQIAPQRIASELADSKPTTPRKPSDPTPPEELLSQYAARPPAPAVDLLAVLNWTEADRRAAFEKSALKRVKLAMLQRNALIAAGNHLAKEDHPPLRQRVAALANDPQADALVRTTAQQVLARLG